MLFSPPESRLIVPEVSVPLTNRDRLLLLSRPLLGLSTVLMVTRVIVFSTMSYWAQLPYDPAHPTPADDQAITYHTTPFIGWCLNHGYLFFLFFFAALAFNTIVESKSLITRPGGVSNLS